MRSADTTARTAPTFASSSFTAGWLLSDYDGKDSTCTGTPISSDVDPTPLWTYTIINSTSSPKNSGLFGTMPGPAVDTGTLDQIEITSIAFPTDPPETQYLGFDSTYQRLRIGDESSSDISAGFWYTKQP